MGAMGQKDWCPPLAPDAYKCPECHINFRNEIELMEHTLDQLKAGKGHVRCAICHKKYHVAGAVLRHVREVRRPFQSLPVPVCRV